MTRTLVDTTSLIAVCMWDDREKTGSNRLGGRRERSDDAEYLANVLSPGIEAITLFDEVLIDQPSLDRNKSMFPSLQRIENQFTLCNTDHDDEKNAYNIGAEVLSPLITQPGPWLVDVLRRHIDFLDTAELSVNTIGFAPSTYWSHISKGRHASALSHGERNLVLSLERQLGQNTPFSGAALASLIRLFYYVVSQEIYNCNLFLHPSRSLFFTGIEDWWRTERNDDPARTIMDAFDAKVRLQFKELQNEWLGGEVPILSSPPLFNYVFSEEVGSGELVSRLLDIRDSPLVVNYRSGIRELSQALEQGRRSEVGSTLEELDGMVSQWTKDYGPQKSQKKRQFTIEVPFVQALGEKVTKLIAPKKATVAQRIFTFLQNLE